MQQQLTAYEKAQQFAQEGNCQAALASITEHLQTNASDGKALNDAGAILYSLGRLDEARQSVEHARRFEGDSPEILWNLAEIYLAQNRPDLVSELITPMRKHGILNADLLNRTATSFLNQQEKADGMEMLISSLDMAPNQDVIRAAIDAVKLQRPKIAFFCQRDKKFLPEIIEFTKQRYPCQVFDGKSYKDMFELMKWSDISWFEWCSEYAIESSKMPKVCRNIVRLHRHEAYKDYPKHVNWANVDVLITVGNSYVGKALRSQVPNIDSITKVLTIPSGINLDKFNYIERKRGKNIACIAYQKMIKNPMFLLQCMQKLHYIDREYKLFIAGSFQDDCLKQYLMHMVRQLDLEGVVHFDEWQDDINKWLEDKHYIVSASIGESQGLGLLEGMARGLKPVIHHFPGADEIFASEFLFCIAEDFCRQILSDSYEPWRYREFVAARYPLQSQMNSFDTIFTHFENNPLHPDSQADHCDNVLVEYDAAVGDIVCIEPAIRALKQKLGENTAITLRVTHPDIFRNHPCVSHVEHTKLPNPSTGYKQHFKFDWNRTDQNASMHLVERSAAQIGVSLEGIDRCPKIYLDGWDEITLEKFHLPQNVCKIAIGAGVRWQSRSWSDAKWIALIAELEKRFSAHIVQLGAPGEKFYGRGSNLIDQTTPREVAAVLSKCDLAICVDNGIAHLAAAVNTPRVVLFGPTEPKSRMHSGICESVVATNSDCLGCFHSSDTIIKNCSKGQTSCMEQITVESVIASVERCLANRNR